MSSLPRLRHVAHFTTTRLPCVARVFATGHASPIRPASGLTLSSLLRPLFRIQQVNDPRPINSTRCISVQAPREPTAGSEPGIDITDEGAWPEWRQKVQSQITAVDFSADRIEKYELSNATLGEFLAKPREDWVTCRWINGEFVRLECLS